MAIVANKTELTLDSSTVGCVRSFSVPAGVVKEVNVTCLDSDIETYQASTLEAAQEMTFTVLFDPGSAALEKGTAATWEIVFPLDDISSTTPGSWSFDGFIRDAGTVDGENTAESPLEQTITVRLSTIITKVLEA